jgi:Protein ENHANCED DISEASE RESISTANCE 2, C-terminal
MSTALVATEDADHEFLDGRPKVFLEHCPTPQPTKSKVPLLPRGSVPSIVRRAQTVPIDDRVPDYALHPPPLRVEHWAEPPATAFKVRGRNYLRDGGIKVTSESSVFRLLTVDLIHTPSPVFTGMCSQPNERIQMALKRERETGVRELPEFVFAVNYYVPAGDPGFHWVAYFGVDDASVLKDPSTPLGRLCHPFFFGPSDTFRTSVFKLIPRIVEGNFVVRKAVGSKPSILGRKLKQYYVQHDRYFELIVDIGSDSVADRIVKVALGAAKSLVVDMMFVLEGNNETTLPERILGGARMQYLDLKRKDLQRRSSSGP